MMIIDVQIDAAVSGVTSTGNRILVAFCSSAFLRHFDGRLALLYFAPRAATVKALQESVASWLQN